MVNDQIKSSYRYHRQTRPMLPARLAIQYARDDARVDRRRYYNGAAYVSVVNSPWQSGSTTLRWIEHPESIGLRLTGFADELVRSIGHKGWYTNEFCEETLRGIVYQWPTRHGARRYVYGYADPDNDGAAALCLNTVDDDRDAARLADSVAEYAASDEREYNEVNDARVQFDELGNEVSDTRKSLLRLIHELKEKRLSLCDAPSIVAELQNSITDKIDSIKDAREKRTTLENEFSYHKAWNEG